jgi:hypothetical protein
MTEPRLVLKMKKALQAEGYYVAKIHGGRYSAGVPDLLIAASTRDGKDAVFVALEVKLPGKEDKVTDLQASQLRSIREAGGCAWVVSSVDDALEVCANLPEGHPNLSLIYERN